MSSIPLEEHHNIINNIKEKHGGLLSHYHKEMNKHKILFKVASNNKKVGRHLEESYEDCSKVMDSVNLKEP